MTTAEEDWTLTDAPASIVTELWDEDEAPPKVPPIAAPSWTATLTPLIVKIILVFKTSPVLASLIWAPIETLYPLMELMSGIVRIFPFALHPAGKEVNW